MPLTFKGAIEATSIRDTGKPIVHGLFFEDALDCEQLFLSLQQLSLNDRCTNSVSDDRDDDTYCSDEEVEVRNRNGEQNSADTQKEWAATARDLREYSRWSIPFQWAWKMIDSHDEHHREKELEVEHHIPYGPIVLHDGAVADSIDDRAYPQSA